MFLYHHSARPFDKEKFRTPKTLGANFKPMGCLWLACDETSWFRFASGALDRPLSLKYLCKMKVDGRKLITLNTLAQIQAFTLRYSKKLEDGGWTVIDWCAVRRSQPGKCGLLLRPIAVEDVTRELLWAYGFDVCSACLWSDACISEVDRL